MNLPYNQPPINVKLSSEELNEFISYLIKCYEMLLEDHTSNTNILLVYKYHLIELINKTVQKRIKIYNQPLKAAIKIKINEIEQHLVSILFKRYECSPFLLQMQPRFINGLVKL
jgi:hypothetical protein